MREGFTPKPTMSVWTAQILDTTAIASEPRIARTQDKLTVIGNGVRPSLSIELSAKNHIFIEMIDMVGRAVATILSGDYGEGEYRVNLPSTIPQGTYVIRMTAISQTNAAQNDFSTLVTKVVIP